MKDTWKRLNGVLAAITLSCVVGCGERNEFKPPPPPQVTVAQAIERPVSDYLEYTGTTVAAEKVDLHARVNGFLREIQFQDGADVNAGDVLFVIERTPFQIALDSAEAKERNAKAQQQNAEAERQKAQAQQERAKANLQLQEASHRRVLELIQRKAASQQELDIQEAQLATARADVATAKAEIAAAEAGIATAETEVAVAAAAVREAKQQLSYTEVRAPISGRIGRHLVDEGNLVTAGQTALATIERIDPIQAYFHISDHDMMKLTESGPNNEFPDPAVDAPDLQLRVANDPAQRVYAGHTDFRQQSVDVTTGTVMCRGIFKNPKREVAPGLFVRIRRELTGDGKPKVLVESRALGADQRGDFVLVVNEKNVVEHRQVKIGIEVDGLRVIEKGVRTGEWIVVDGLQRARPASPVSPQQTKMLESSAEVTPSNAEAMPASVPKAAG